eukprot:gene7356-11678_t
MSQVSTTSNSSSLSQERYLFKIRVENAKDLGSILASLSLNSEKETWALVEFSDRNIKFSVEDSSKCFSVHATVKKDIFQDYKFTSTTNVIFKLNIGVLMDCLNLYGSSTQSSQLQLQYPGLDRTLKVQLTDINGVLTDCSIRTREADDEDELNFHFRDHNVNNKIVMKSEVLKEILTEMQSFEENVQISISPDQPYFEFHTENTIIGDLTCSLPKTSEAFYTFECEKKHVFRYKYKHMNYCLKALSLGHSLEKTSIQMNELGTLSIKNEIRTQPSVTLVEYMFTPENVSLDEDDDFE